MSIILMVILFLIIPGFVYLLTAFFLFRKYLESYKEIHRDSPSKGRMGEIDFQKIILILALLMPSFFYGLIVFIMVLSSGDLESFQWDFVLYIGIFFGIANILAIIGMGYYHYQSIDEIVRDPRILLKSDKPYSPFSPRIKYTKETKELIKKQTFAKHLTIGLGPHSISIFSFFLVLLILVFSGIIGTEGAEDGEDDGISYDSESTDLGPSDVEEVRWASIVMVIASFSTFILSIFLPRVKVGSIKDRKVFTMRMILMISLQIPMAIGLFISYMIIS